MGSSRYQEVYFVVFKMGHSVTWVSVTLLNCIQIRAKVSQNLIDSDKFLILANLPKLDFFHPNQKYLFPFYSTSKVVCNSEKLSKVPLTH